MPKKQDHEKERASWKEKEQARKGFFLTSFEIGFPIQNKPSPLNIIYNGNLA